MLSTSFVGKFVVLFVLGGGWLLVGRYVLRFETGQSFHVAASQRDQRKARFYYFSFWAGLIAAALSFLFQETLDKTSFASMSEREWVYSLVRGIGMWGLMTVGMIWNQVGLRASQTNVDGRSLIPLREEGNEKTGK